MKKNAYYFSHDSNARTDEKIIKLRFKLGYEGYGIYWAVVESLHDASGLRLQCNYDILAYNLHCDDVKLKSVVEDFGLFSIEDNFFYSQSLMNRMILKEEKSTKARESAKKRWDKVQNVCDGNANALRDACDGNASKVKERKVKESKDKKHPTLNEFTEYCNTTLSDYELDPKLMYAHYDENNWHDAKGNEVVNWKNKIRNWCKPSNKKETNVREATRKAFEHSAKTGLY